MDFDALTLADLRQRQSIKWTLYGEKVLPLWVAEADVPLAPAVQDALTEAVSRGDTGYACPTGLAPAFSGFAARRWGWEPDPTWCTPVADVMTGVVEVLHLLTAPGDGVVICPPVYHPFFDVPDAIGRQVVPVPLVDGALDLAGIDAALADGARAVLLSSPHNPTGRVWTSAELDALDAVVSRRKAVVLSDEVHAPMTLPGATFTPYLAEGPREAVVLTSASKAFNLAGLKAALIVAGSGPIRRRLRSLPLELPYKVGHFGAIAGTAAFREGDGWLDGFVAHLDRMRDLVQAGLPSNVSWTRPEAGYLAWLDFHEPAPAARLLAERDLALVEGSEFLGGSDSTYARLNFGTTSEVLTEALRRLA